jgi:trans-2,3-dihydro-3-hydroxyanthranilate isomerase
MREFEYHLCDVFAARRLEGNQLAVFIDAAALSDAEMQAIAREMNLSETTFVLRRDSSVEQARGVRVRIFTTQEELPFAGHPTLGTAAMIRGVLPDFKNARTVVLDLNAGPVEVGYAQKNHINEDAVFGEMKQLNPVFGSRHNAETVAPLLGLSLEDMAEQPPQTVSTGVPFCIVALRTLEGLARLRVDVVASARYLSGSDAKFFYAVAPEGEEGWRARMQFYGGEDPATGSAAGCAISYMVRHGLWASGVKLHLRQGVEMKRPSDLYISANFENGKVGGVRVGGSTVPVANGRLFLE